MKKTTMASDSNSNSNNLKSRGRFDINAIPDHAKARNPHLFGEDGKGQARLPSHDGHDTIKPRETKAQQRIAELNERASQRLNNAIKKRQARQLSKDTANEAKARVTRCARANIEMDADGQNETIARLKSLNKTERLFYDTVIPTLFAKADGDGSDGGDDYIVIVQPTRLFALEGGGTYTPDFLVCTQGKVHVFEVKGGYRGAGWEQGMERYKRAAAQFDKLCIHFYIYDWDRKNNKWRAQKWRAAEK